MYQLKGVDTAGNNRMVAVCGSLTHHTCTFMYVLRVTKCLVVLVYNLFFYASRFCHTFIPYRLYGTAYIAHWFSIYGTAGFFLLLKAPFIFE